jgi:hypothetical protein
VRVCKQGGDRLLVPVVGVCGVWVCGGVARAKKRRRPIRFCGAMGGAGEMSEAFLLC